MTPWVLRSQLYVENLLLHELWLCGCDGISEKYEIAVRKEKKEIIRLLIGIVMRDEVFYVNGQ